ncbi:MAG: hypothetical protein L0221_02470, partial [Chloroflexi bacterium]|nr:hypothetical protein [Chloroflexota bacterium]
HGREVVASPLLPPRAKLDFVAYVGQLLAAPFILGSMLAAAPTGQLATAAILNSGYLAASGFLAWVGLGREARADGIGLGALQRLRGAIHAALFSYIWLAAIPGALARLALRRGPLTFSKTVHGVTPSEPEPITERG